jgi:hypothetical protein
MEDRWHFLSKYALFALSKPGFANRCPSCSEPESSESTTKRTMDADERKLVTEANEARRRAMRDLLYRKDS